MFYGNSKEEIKAEIKAKEEYQKAQEIVDRNKRNWFERLDDPWFCGLNGEGLYFISHLILRAEKDSINLFGWAWGERYVYEIFRTKEKLDDFIETLIRTRNMVFK